MPPTTPTDSAMCSLCPRSKKAHHPKKLVRFDSIVDTFSISDSNAITNQRVRGLISIYNIHFKNQYLLLALSDPLLKFFFFFILFYAFNFKYSLKHRFELSTL